jgi:hypothetical protein
VARVVRRRWTYRPRKVLGARVTPRDEEAELPAPVDAITAAIGTLIVAVMEATEADGAARARAMTEVLKVGHRIRAAINRPRLN